jgi:Tfp pilus assembly protein PilO
LIDAAREVQEATLSGPASEAAPAELEQVLRPALARISERIAWLLVRLPEPLDEAELKDVLAPISQAGVTSATQGRIGHALQGLRGL